jgi:hypothetical protein
MFVMLCYVMLCVCCMSGVLVYVMASFNVCRSIYVMDLLCFRETHFADEEEDECENAEQEEFAEEDPYCVEQASCIYVQIMCSFCVASMLVYVVLCFCVLVLILQRRRFRSATRFSSARLLRICSRARSNDHLICLVWVFFLLSGGVGSAFWRASTLQWQCLWHATVYTSAIVV